MSRSRFSLAASLAADSSRSVMSPIAADNANRLARIVADNQAARNHPAIRAIAVFEPQFVEQIGPS